MAVGIMIFHYSLWTFGEFASETFLGRLGIYGVSIFYILSGLTLYYVYHTVMVPSKADILTFAKKRFFRIYPLLGLATILTIILSRQFPDILTLAFNQTVIFVIVKWD